MRRVPARRPQRGAMAVELGLSVIVLFMALMGAMEVGRLLWVWNAAAEATRLGARLAAVCTIDEERIKVRMREHLPGNVTAAHIALTYTNPGGGGGGCNANNCRLVTVALQNYSHLLLVPLPAGLASIALPPFKTTLPREVFNNANNPACTS